jgi:hypothetical protein
MEKAAAELRVPGHEADGDSAMTSSKGEIPCGDLIVLQRVRFC